MKKITLAVAMVLALGWMPTFATSVNNATIIEMQEDEFTKIENSELPEVVAKAIAEKYAQATITEAYVATRESGKIYKVVLSQNDEVITIILDEKGEEVPVEE